MPDAPPSLGSRALGSTGAPMSGTRLDGAVVSATDACGCGRVHEVPPVYHAPFFQMHKIMLAHGTFSTS